jgi:hypothetical protein
MDEINKIVFIHFYRKKDKRHFLILNRLLSLSLIELYRIIVNSNLLCLDTYNYNEKYKTFCPLALALNLNETIKNPTDEIITNELSKRFNPVNILKGVPGKFYTLERKNDIINLVNEVIKFKNNF